ncbi:MAG: hypothetical protein Q9219_006830 [cf. Caloplaca sp. 3 TL-2023]
MSLTFALQSLLARHEAYVLEAEEERRRMATSIDKLELDKKELESANARTIEDNRNLVDQLEALNNTLSGSESHILSLNATLQSTRQELDRLNALAARTSHLEEQLSLMETEQTTLHDRLASSEEDQRSAVQRWKDAERTIGVLQDQIDRIEAEAKDETERHAEVMNRYERRQAVERQLENAAGRLKGAAAATTLGKGDGKNHVVSHFVKDILADNASLQMGIMELREMLMGSNEEVQNLREQMMLHQQIPSNQHQDSSPVALEKELDHGRLYEPDNVPALHVHHHYHEASKLGSPRRHRSTGPRRAKRRRNPNASGLSTPRSGLETPSMPRTPIMYTGRLQAPSSAATILSQTSASIPSPHDPYSRRPSVHSTNTRSSGDPSLEPSSPHPSTFEFLSESSRPTSPETSDIFPPPFSPLRNKRDRSISSHSPRSPTKASLQRPSHAEQLDIQDDHFSKYGPISLGPNPGQNAIVEEPEHEWNVPNASNDRTLAQGDSIYSPSPTIRRPASHESILSTAKHHPPTNRLRHQQSLLFRGAHLQSRTSLAPSSPTTSMVSSKPVVISASTSSVPVPQNPDSNSNRAVSSSGAMSTLTSSLQSNQAHPDERGSLGLGLGQRVGGWVWGKWGVAPVARTGGEPGKKERAAGVNQKGSLKRVKGEKVGRKVVGRVEPVDVDEGLLRESLGEG